MATLQICVDDHTKDVADALFGSLGLDTSTAVRMFITASIYHRGIPFTVQQPNSLIELNDGYGSYVCEYGHLHDYRKLQPKLDEATKEVVGPFHSLAEMMKGLDGE